MPLNKRQLLRLIRLVGELKQNRYPNSITFAAKLNRLDISENMPLSCTAKTIKRDIKTLKDDFNAPIKYDKGKKGYYLTHHGWDFRCPLFEEGEMLASILGAKVAEDIFPPPVKDNIRHATDGFLTENNPDFLDTAYIQSLIVASGLKVSIKPEIFGKVFEAWQNHLEIKIKYKSATGEVSEREIEPHVLGYMESAWFIKGFCLLRKAVRTFAIHRMLSVEYTGRKFEPDVKIIEDAKSGLLFEYKNFNNILMECDNSILPLITEKPLHSQQKIKNGNKNSFLLSIPSASEYELVSWIFTQRGKARLIKPGNLVSKIAKTALQIAQMHTGK